MVDRERHAEHAPFLRRLGQAGVFHQSDVVVVVLAGMIAAVELHVGRVRPVRAGLQLADLFQADDLGPECVRFVHVPHIQHQMIEA